MAVKGGTGDYPNPYYGYKKWSAFMFKALHFY